MSRKFGITIILAASTVFVYWYGARPQPMNPAVPSISGPLAVAPIPPEKEPASAALNRAEFQPQTADSTADAVKKPIGSESAYPLSPRPRPDTETPAKIEADAVALNIRSYSQRFGGNPVGSNAEIVKELTGRNSAGVTYLPADLQHFNDQGELIDTWGTPYFFHQNSATYMEVRSAGPDKILHTIDDVTAR